MTTRISINADHIFRNMDGGVNQSAWTPTWKISRMREWPQHSALFCRKDNLKKCFNELLSFKWILTRVKQVHTKLTRTTSRSAQDLFFLWILNWFQVMTPTSSSSVPYPPVDESERPHKNTRNPKLNWTWWCLQAFDNTPPTQTNEDHSLGILLHSVQRGLCNQFLPKHERHVEQAQIESLHDIHCANLNKHA